MDSDTNAGPPSPPLAGSERVKVQCNEAGRYRVMLDGIQWGYFVPCDYGGGVELFETRFLWRARREAAKALRWLLRKEAGGRWHDVPNNRISG